MKWKTHSGCIRDQTLKLSDIELNFGRFFAFPNFWGCGPHKSCTKIIMPAVRHVTCKNSLRLLPLAPKLYSRIRWFCGPNFTAPCYIVFWIYLHFLRKLTVTGFWVGLVELLNDGNIYDFVCGWQSLICLICNTSYINVAFKLHVTIENVSTKWVNPILPSCPRVVC